MQEISEVDRSIIEFFTLTKLLPTPVWKFYILY